MARILIRDIEDDIKERLRRRAARHGRSLEAEIRDILRDALETEDASQGGLGSRIATRFKHVGFHEGEDIPRLCGYAIKSPFEE